MAETKASETTKSTAPKGPSDVEKFAQEVMYVLMFSHDPTCQIQDAKALCIRAGATPAVAAEQYRAKLAKTAA